MATSIIKLYKTKLTPTRNALIEDIEDYLSTCQSTTVNDFQYVKHNLNISVKLDMPQREALEPSYNYVSIKNSDSNRTFYYFILDTEWRSQQTVQLQLSIDSANTFYDKINGNWTPKTKILRQHENRFEIPTSVSSYSTLLNRRISRTEEMVNNVATELATDETITANDNNKWYLVYQSNESVTTTDAINAIYCYLVPKNHVPVASYASSSSIIAALNIPQNKYFMWLKSENPNTTSISFTDPQLVTTQIPLDRNDIVYFYRTTENKLMAIFVNSLGVRITVDTSGALIFNGLTQVRYNSKQSISGSTVMPWTGGYRYSNYYDLIDRTDTKILKIIECPYCPVEYVMNSDGTYGFGIAFDITATNDIKLIDSSLEFEKVVLDTDLDNMTVGIPAKTQRWNQEPNQAFESKLYNSNFNNLVYQYDSESIAVRREAIVQGDGDPTEIILKYKQANTITSNLLFDAIISNSIYDKNSPQELLMLSNRNNEMPLYNSAYLNYLRTGYNYDMKSRKQQLISNVIGTTINTAGAAASLGFGAAKSSAVSSAAGIGLVTNTINSIVGTINSYVTATNAINQKRKKLCNKRLMLLVQMT